MLENVHLGGEGEEVGDSAGGRLGGTPPGAPLLRLLLLLHLLPLAAQRSELLEIRSYVLRTAGVPNVT